MHEDYREVYPMPTLTLSDQQAIDLVRQLPPTQQAAVFKYLLTQRWQTWASLSHEGEGRIRQLALERGRDWDTMMEEEREIFVDDLVHEDRGCL
jgi:hypothetical protein